MQENKYLVIRVPRNIGVKGKVSQEEHPLNLKENGSFTAVNSDCI